MLCWCFLNSWNRYYRFFSVQNGGFKDLRLEDLNYCLFPHSAVQRRRSAKALLPTPVVWHVPAANQGGGLSPCGASLVEPLLQWGSLCPLISISLSVNIPRPYCVRFLKNLLSAASARLMLLCCCCFDCLMGLLLLGCYWLYALCICFSAQTL